MSHTATCRVCGRSQPEGEVFCSCGAPFTTSVPAEWVVPATRIGGEREPVPQAVCLLPAGVRIVLDEGDEIELGRDATGAVGAGLRGCDNVSRRHARLRFAGGELVVIDLQSSNGTFVDSRRIAPYVATPLLPGMSLRLAADRVVEFEVVVRQSSGGG